MVLICDLIDLTMAVYCEIHFRVYFRVYMIQLIIIIYFSIGLARIKPHKQKSYQFNPEEVYINIDLRGNSVLKS